MKLKKTCAKLARGSKSAALLGPPSRSKLRLFTLFRKFSTLLVNTSVVEGEAEALPVESAIFHEKFHDLNGK